MEISQHFVLFHVQLWTTCNDQCSVWMIMLSFLILVPQSY